MSQVRNTPTRKDVAALAGVSETVVSYVLNNNRYVAQDKRERVLAAVRELHYRPNTVALMTMPSTRRLLTWETNSSSLRSARREMR